MLIFALLIMMSTTAYAFDGYNVLVNETCDSLNASLWTVVDNTGGPSQIVFNGRCMFDLDNGDVVSLNELLMHTNSNYTVPTTSGSYLNLSYDVKLDVPVTTAFVFGFGNISPWNTRNSSRLVDYFLTTAGQQRQYFVYAENNTGPTGESDNYIFYAPYNWYTKSIIINNDCSVDTDTIANSTLINNNDSVTTSCHYDNFPIHSNMAWAGVAPEEIYLDNIILTSNEFHILNFTVYDEESDLIINYTNISYRLIKGFDVYDEGNTTTGMINVSGVNIVAGEYVMNYWADQYPPRKYLFTISSSDTQYLNYTLYSVNYTLSNLVTLYVKDYANDKYLEGAKVTIRKSIMGSYETIFSGYTDLTGAVYTYLNTTDEYQIEVSMDDYGTKSGFLRPEAFPYVYTLYISPLDVNELGFIWQNTSYYYQPTESIINTTMTYFNLTTYSPTGSMDYFMINTTINGTHFSNISYTEGGGTINLYLNLTNVSNQFFNVTYSIKVSGFDVWNATQRYFYWNETPTNTSLIPGLAGIREEFGLGTRIILTIIISIVVALLFTYVIAGTYAAMLGIATFASFSFAGFVPSWIATVAIGMGVVLWLTSEGEY